MKRLLLSLFLLALLIFLQPWLNAFPFIRPICLIPILLVFWAWQMDDAMLIWLALVGGIVNDWLIPDAPGTGPVIWVVVLLLMRTQRPLLAIYGTPFAMLATFATSFLFLSFQRLAFLAAHDFWSWDYNLSVRLFVASLINAVVSPFCFTILKLLYREPQEDQPVMSHVRF
ncbi:MAG: hypothetical protein V1746_03515 [bacterium]